MTNPNHITVGLAQIAPVWLNRAQTLEKILDYISQAGDQNCNLVAFGEALLPGYPFWIDLTHGSLFDSPLQRYASMKLANLRLACKRSDLIFYGRRG